MTDFRWDPYFLRKGNEVEIFWHEYLDSSRKILYILGCGFDPRMCDGISVIKKAGPGAAIDCLLIRFDEGDESPSRVFEKQTKDNLDKLQKIHNASGAFIIKELPMWSEDRMGRHRVGSLNASLIFNDPSELRKYTDIIVDISAMPRSIYFSLIGKILFLLEKSQSPNLYIMMSENVELDKKIQEIGIDDTANYIHGFSGGLEMESSAGIPKVWIPVLGESQQGQLEKISNLVLPDTVCPVLPSPSSNLRRGDELILEYHKFLFRKWEVEPKNFIYTSEKNPFETYRQVVSAIRRYNRSLSALGGCKITLSALSSKLLSVGVLLAAYEMKMENQKVGIAIVEPQGYEMVGGYVAPTDGEIFTFCLSGDSYAD